MEASIRWSPHATANARHFVLLDVKSSRLRLCSLDNIEIPQAQFSVLSQRDKLPNFTAFDFSRTDPYIVGLGGHSGGATILNIDPSKPQGEALTLPVRYQRRCLSIAFSARNHVVTGGERVRNDHGIYLYDLNALGNSTPTADSARKLALADGITSVRFFSQQPNVLLAGVQKQGYVRLYDLRDSNPSSTLQFPTRLVHNLAVDPLDDNYFISSGPEKDATVGVWDRRALKSASASVPVQDTGSAGPVMEIRAAIDVSHSCSINSLRFSGVKRGCFSVLSSSGEVRVFELAQNSVRPSLGNPPPNPNGGTLWLSPTYTRRTHSLSSPIWSPQHPRDDQLRIIACDFITTPGIVSDTSLLSLTQNGQVRRLKVHNVPRKLNITALDEIWLWKDKPKLVKQPPRNDMSASQALLVIQNKAKVCGKRSVSDQAKHRPTSRLENPSLESSLSRHQDLLTLNFPRFIPKLPDVMSLLPIQRRRCEEGYALDPSKNERIVANDRWLAGMWGTIKRLDDHAKDDGMLGEGIDLSFLGVYAIWTMDFGVRNRLVGTDSLTQKKYEACVAAIVDRKYLVCPFKGHTTKYAARRQLCLSLCGWAFSKDALRPRCQALMEQGECYKAIVVAVMRGFNDLAQELLRSAIQTKKIENIGLGAVIACETVNDDQRDMCKWMAEDAEDPYLKAILAYFVSGDWKVVVDMALLPLSDRVGCALKYLDDDRVGSFILMQTSVAAVNGNVEGLVLTGLTERTLDLFQNYVANFSDLQTAVLAMSISCPLYLDDRRFSMWRETYLMQMQSWQTYNQRTVYLQANARRSTARSGARFGSTSAQPITLRCTQCLGTLSPHTLRNMPPPPPPSNQNQNQNQNPPTPPNLTPPMYQNQPPRPRHEYPPQNSNPLSLLMRNKNNSIRKGTGTVVTVDAPRMSFQATPAARSGLVCPRCGRSKPRCGICSLVVANPDPRKAIGDALQLTKDDDILARQALYCMTCTHIFHGDHARDWFARHKVCPVPECQCMCGFLH
jgi:WD40 repeat protein